MDLPFTQEQLFDAFAATNARTSMAETVVGYLGAFASIPLRRRSSERLRPFLFAGLALLWAWIAIGFFGGAFRRVAPSALPFGVLFLAQAALFLRLATSRHPASPADPGAWRKRLGETLELYALLVYPLLGLWSGHDLLSLPWFGTAPCPSTIWTIGVLVGVGGCGGGAFVLPLVWCAVGMGAAICLGVVQDGGLGLAACVVLASWIIQRGRGKGREAEASSAATW